MCPMTGSPAIINWQGMQAKTFHPPGASRWDTLATHIRLRVPSTRAELDKALGEFVEYSRPLGTSCPK